MKNEAISTLGLLLCLAPAVVHIAELPRPLWGRWVVNWVLPFFGPGFPKASQALTHDEQLAMLDAAKAVAPEHKKTAAADYIFLLLFEGRQNALLALSIAAGIFYGLSLELAERHAIHLILTVMALLFTLVNANHAGVPGLGHHPRVSRNGRGVGVVFSVFWAFVLVLNWLAFRASAL